MAKEDELTLMKQTIVNKVYGINQVHNFMYLTLANKYVLNDSYLLPMRSAQ